MAKNEATYGRKGKEPLRSSKYGKSVQIPSQNLHMDPKGLSSFRGKGVYIAQGDTVTVKGTKAIRADKKPVKATWY